jgi:hypothetical protein
MVTKKGKPVPRTSYLKRTARAKMLIRRPRNLDTRTRYLKRTARASMLPSRPRRPVTRVPTSDTVFTSYD